jgi:hypothetical protein
MSRSVTTVIPAANEQHLIGPCVDAVATASVHAQHRTTFPVEMGVSR